MAQKPGNASDKECGKESPLLQAASQDSILDGLPQATSVHHSSLGGSSTQGARNSGETKGLTVRELGLGLASRDGLFQQGQRNLSMTEYHMVTGTQNLGGIRVPDAGSGGSCSQEICLSTHSCFPFKIFL